MKIAWAEVFISTNMTDCKEVDTKCGKVKLATIVGSDGRKAEISTLGACITRLYTPDRNGMLRDVVLGYEDVADYMADGPCYGKIPGRFAGRIALGRFTLDGKEYRLATNNGPNALHGGPTGFQNCIWTLIDHTPEKVVLQYVSADMEEGYPGQLTVTVVYAWKGDELSLEIKAETTKPTIVNLTNHSYFNLAGHERLNSLDQELKLHATWWLPTDETQIPTGEMAPVKGTPMDFSDFKALGRDLRQDFKALKIGKGYDNVWIVDGKSGEMRTAAELLSRESGIKLTLQTDAPAVVVYTGNWLGGCPTGKGGVTYSDYDGVALECQGLPDAPNKPGFPSQRLDPGEIYSETIIFGFSTFDKD